MHFMLLHVETTHTSFLKVEQFQKKDQKYMQNEILIFKNTSNSKHQLPYLKKKSKILKRHVLMLKNKIIKIHFLEPRYFFELNHLFILIHSYSLLF